MELVWATSGTAHSKALGDDIQAVPVGTTGLMPDTVVVSPGPNGVLDSNVIGDDVAEVVSGYETSIDNDGVERLVRVGSFHNGDFGRKWVVVIGENNQSASADFGSLIARPGKDFYLVFVQDLDEDGLDSRQEQLAGSTDSQADIYQNDTFGTVVKPTAGHPGFLVADPTKGSDGIRDSRDTDRDGIGDYAEVAVGWKVSENGILAQVYSSPRLPDSDGDGLLDPQEENLRPFCAPSSLAPAAQLNDDGVDPRQDAMCPPVADPVSKIDAIEIIAGSNGRVDSTLAGDDVWIVPSLFHDPLLKPDAPLLSYGTPIIGPGPNGKIDTDWGGDDAYASTTSLKQAQPSSNPTSPDTDGDGVTDYDEVMGYTVALSIRDGGTACSYDDTLQGVAGCVGRVDSSATGDDVQRVRVGGPVAAGGIVVLPGPDGVINNADLNNTPLGNAESGE